MARITMRKIRNLIWELYARAVSYGLDFTGLINKPARDFLPRILIYHNLSPYCLKAFETQLDYFTKNYKVVPLSELISNLESARGDKLLSITFDDAYKSVYTNGVALLDKYGIKPCLFVPAGFIGARDEFRYINKNMKSNLNEQAVSWRQLQSLVSRGYEIGSHSFSHVDFGKGDVDYDYELGQSREFLQEKLNTPINYFAFPFGGAENITDYALTKARDYQYRRVFSGMRGRIKKDDFLLPRTYINPAWGLELVKGMCLGFFDIAGTKT